MSDAPDPPTGLLKASLDRWAAFWASDVAKKVDQRSDLPRLIRWIEQSDEYDRVVKVCRQSRLVKGSMGQPVLNPLVGYLGQLEAQIARTEADFGMTPLARQRLKEDVRPAAPGEPKPDGLDELGKRRQRKAAGA